LIQVLEETPAAREAMQGFFTFRDLPAIPALTVDKAEVNEYRLEKGPQVISHISAEQWEKAEQGKKDFQVKDGEVSAAYAWPQLTHSYLKMDESYRITSLIENLYKQGEGHSADDPIVLLSWGSGKGEEISGLWDTVKALKDTDTYRDLHVRVIGYARDFYEAWNGLPTEVSMIVDEADNLIDDLHYLGVKKIHVLFSLMGFKHYLTDAKESALDHLRQLGGMLAPRGEIRIDIVDKITDAEYQQMGLLRKGPVNKWSTTYWQVERIVKADERSSRASSLTGKAMEWGIWGGFIGTGVRSAYDAYILPAINGEISVRRVLFVGGAAAALGVLAVLWNKKTQEVVLEQEVSKLSDVEFIDFLKRTQTRVLDQEKKNRFLKNVRPF
jgi:hypothetical protein